MTAILRLTLSSRPEFCRATAFIFTAILLMGINSAGHAAVIAVSSSLDLSATAGRSGSSHPEDTDTASASQGATTHTLGPLSVLASTTSGLNTLTTSGSGLATWVNTAQGQVRFNDLGWDNSGAQNTGIVNSTNSLAGTKWSYTFIADITGLFTLDWMFAYDPGNTLNSFGLDGFVFSLTGAGGGQTIINDFLATGSTTRNITAGQQYTALIETDNGIGGGVGNRVSFMDGIFDWSMDSGPPDPVPESTTPEPTTIALLTLGLAGIAASGRSRRRRAK